MLVSRPRLLFLQISCSGLFSLHQCLSGQSFWIDTPPATSISMTKKPTLPQSPRSTRSSLIEKNASANVHHNRIRTRNENSDVLVSAVISSYLLTHLHHVLQKAEFSSAKEGRMIQAENFAELRKVLCMDARSMKDASASGRKETDSTTFQDSNFGPKVA